MSADESLVGRTIADRYVVSTLLGRGGAGVVYRAQDTIVNEDIAVKVMQQTLEKDPYEVERFRRELVTARKVSHPNVIRIHDMGPLGDAFFISMELLEGGSLADLLRKGPVAIPRAIEIAIGVCDGLHAAHTQSVIHRDLKPDNVLFDMQGVPKLVDFGLARLSDSRTRTGGFTGTPFYMSPEQADGRDPTVRSDVYSLGVLLFELFTGKRPFVAESLVRLITLHLSEPPPSPRSIRPEVPPAIEELILRCLEKKPAQRPATAGEIASALRILGLEATIQPSTSASAARLPSMLAPPRRPSPWRRYGVAAAVLAVLAVLTGALVAPRDETGRGVAATGTHSGTAAGTAAGTANETKTAVVQSTPTAVPAATETAVALATRTAVAHASPARTAPPTPVATAAVALPPATLAVTSVGRVGLDVYLDGNRVGDIPLLPPVEVPPGSHVLSLRKRGDSTDLGTQAFEAKSGASYEFKAAYDTGNALTFEKTK